MCGGGILPQVRASDRVCPGPSGSSALPQACLLIVYWSIAVPETHGIAHLFSRPWTRLLAPLPCCARGHRPTSVDSPPPLHSPPPAPAAGVLAASAAAGAARWARDLRDEAVQQKRRLAWKMAASRSYFEWSINAAKLDALEGVDQQQRWSQETRLYDRKLLRCAPAGAVEQVPLHSFRAARMMPRAWARDPPLFLPPSPSPFPFVQGEGGPPAQGAGGGRGGRPDVCAARRPPAQPGQHH
jgi:hypothetical protein